MTPEELRRDEAARWLAAAARDLKSARLLAGEENTGSVFHSQQAAEKSAKAFLAFHNVPFRKTHDLQELGKQCVNLDTSLADVLAEAENLTDYAVIFRYQDAPYEPDQAEATSALEIARGAVRTSAITRDLTNATTTHERVGYPHSPPSSTTSNF